MNVFSSFQFFRLGSALLSMVAMSCHPVDEATQTESCVDCIAISARACDPSKGKTSKKCGSDQDTSCVPTMSCDTEGYECGEFIDNCGNNVRCGMCPDNTECNDDRQCKKITSDPCVPTITCASTGRQCGTLVNDCGQTELCPNCSDGFMCDEEGRCQPDSEPPAYEGIGPISPAYRQGGLWLSPEEIQEIPMDNPSWDSLVQWARAEMNIVEDIGHTAGGAGPDSVTTRAMYARAIVGLRTQNSQMVVELRTELDRVQEGVDRAIDSGNRDVKWPERNLALIAVAANLIDYRPSSLLRGLRRALEEKDFFLRAPTVRWISLYELPNKPAHGLWSLLAYAYLAEDWETVNLCVKAHAKAMGEPNWAGLPNDHRYELTGRGDDDDWQMLQPGGKSDPIAIMPSGLSFEGHPVGGLYLADQYRAENGPVWPPSYTNYAYEGLSPRQAFAWAAHHLGYKGVFALGNYALLRALLFAFAEYDGKEPWPAVGNDIWQVAAVMAWAQSEFGGTLPENLKPGPRVSVPWPLPVSPEGLPGRAMGFMYATHYARFFK